jgi:hypothetical protein
MYKKRILNNLTKDDEAEKEFITLLKKEIGGKECQNLDRMR